MAELSQRLDLLERRQTSTDEVVAALQDAGLPEQLDCMHCGVCSLERGMARLSHDVCHGPSKPRLDDMAAELGRLAEQVSTLQATQQVLVHGVQQALARQLGGIHQSVVTAVSEALQSHTSHVESQLEAVRAECLCATDQASSDAGRGLALGDAVRGRVDSLGDACARAERLGERAACGAQATREVVRRAVSDVEALRARCGHVESLAADAAAAARAAKSRARGAHETAAARAAAIEREVAGLATAMAGALDTLADGAHAAARERAATATAGVSSSYVASLLEGHHHLGARADASRVSGTALGSCLNAAQGAFGKYLEGLRARSAAVVRSASGGPQRGADTLTKDQSDAAD